MSSASPPSPATNTTAPPPSVTPSPPPVVSSPPPSVTPSPPPVVSSPPPAVSPPPSPALSPPPPVSDSPPPPPSTTPASPPPPSSTPASPPPPSTTPASPPPPSSTVSSPPPPSSTVSSPPPPPPTPSSKSNPSPPPPTSSSSTPSPPSTSTSSSSSSSLPISALVGIAISGVVILLLLAFLCICSNKRRRRRNDHGNENYYNPPPPPPPAPKDGYYGGAAQHWQQSNPPPPDKYAMPRPLPNRPPTPPIMNNSGGSGSNYSGSGVPLPPPSPGMEFAFSKNAFSYEELERATEGFSDDNILGQGGFGYVHKGVLPNGKEVAVKSLKEGSVQGDREFQAEVEIISRVHHRHLVSLVGYCIAGSQRMLVYEFVPNKTFEFHLHGKGQSTMNWPTRLKIALGSAKGLAYLHEDCHPKIIHRDIKAANILLDLKFEAKVADFGLAKLSSDLNTHISTRVMGTFGYLAPEYAASGKLTDKSDVFSFGVMLLELITGHRPIDTTNTYTDDSLVDWARPLLSRALEDNNFDSLVDPRLQKNYDQNEMARMVACAAASVRHSARRRPRMSQVVRALEGDVSLSALNDGVKPGHSSAYSSYGSSDYDTSQYKEDMKKFRQTAFTSQEVGSSEYGGTTSEYGVNPSGSSSEAPTTREMEMGKVKTDSQGFTASDSTEHTTGETQPDKAKKDS